MRERERDSFIEKRFSKEGKDREEKREKANNTDIKKLAQLFLYMHVGK